MYVWCMLIMTLKKKNNLTGSSVGRRTGINYAHREIGDKVIMFIQYVLLSGEGILAVSYDVEVMISELSVKSVQFLLHSLSMVSSCGLTDDGFEIFERVVKRVMDALATPLLLPCTFGFLGHRRDARGSRGNETSRW